MFEGTVNTTNVFKILFIIFLVVSIVFVVFTILLFINVNALGSENYNLTSEVDYLTSEVDYLTNEVDSLRASRLHRVNFHYIESGSPPGQTVNAKGAIFNSGTERAYNVVLTIFFYDEYDTLLKSEEIQLGTIYGKNYRAFDVDIDCPGDPVRAQTQINYTAFP